MIFLQPRPSISCRLTRWYYCTRQRARNTKTTNTRSTRWRRRKLPWPPSPHTRTRLRRAWGLRVIYCSRDRASRVWRPTLGRARAPLWRRLGNPLLRLLPGSRVRVVGYDWTGIRVFVLGRFCCHISMSGTLFLFYFFVTVFRAGKGAVANRINIFLLFLFGWKLSAWTTCFVNFYVLSAAAPIIVTPDARPPYTPRATQRNACNGQALPVYDASTGLLLLCSACDMCEAVAWRGPAP